MIYTYGISGPDFQEVDKNFIYSYFEGKNLMNLDTETTGKDVHKNNIISLQVGDDENQFFIDIRKVDIREFKELVESKLCILQNSKFDYKFLKKSGIYMENIYDTMLADCVIFCGYEKVGYSLDKIAERWLGKSISKEVRKDFSTLGDRPFQPRHVEYGCTDISFLQAIREKQLKRLEELDLIRCINLENEVVKAFGDIEYNGVSLNVPAWRKISEETREEAQKLEKELDEIVRSDNKISHLYRKSHIQVDIFGGVESDININYASPIQISRICTQLGFPTESTDEKHLSRLKKKHPFFEKLLDLRKKNKIISTYGESFLGYINPVTGRLHTSFWQIVDTGRTSSGNKDDNAPNMQNLPHENRFINCFIARPGYSWVSTDFSGQEMRLMASAAKEKALLDILNSGKDVHCEVGSMMFKKTITKTDKELRYKAKTVNFMVPYGATAEKLADEMEIPVSEATELLNLHSESLPDLHRWLKEQGRFAKKNEYSVTIGPIGRKRFYPKMKEAKELRKSVMYGDKATWKRILVIEGQTERNGGNTPVQGGSADMTKESMVEVRNLIKEFDRKYGEDSALFIGMVHDSLECEAKDEIAEEFAKQKNKLMVEVANRYLEGVEMVADTTIQKYWQK